MVDVLKTHRVLFDNISSSKSIRGISPILDSSYPKFFTSMAQIKTPVSLIITEPILEIIKKDYSKELRAFLSLENARLYTIKEARIAFIVTDAFMTFSLYKRNGEFDFTTSLISFEPSAIKWGEDLFEYYQKMAVEVKQ